MRCAEGGAPENAMEGGRVRDPAVLGGMLRQLLARADITTSRALIAASDSIASFRVLTFPNSTSDADIDATVAAKLPTATERFAIRRLEILPGRPQRTVYATVWDRDEVRAITETAKHAGIEASVVDLKSLCIARAVAIPSCVVLDMSSEPFEVVLIEDHVPRVWHSFKVGSDGDLGTALFEGVRPVLSFYKSSGGPGLDPTCPIVIRSEQVLPSQMSAKLGDLAGHPVEPLQQPARVDPDLRYGPYLACVGLVMRRRA